MIHLPLKQNTKKNPPKFGGFFVQVEKELFIANYLQQTSFCITLHGEPQGAGPQGSAHLLAQPPNTELKNKPITTAATAFFMRLPFLKFN